jgi:hypothetical protein
MEFSHMLLQYWDWGLSITRSDCQWGPTWIVTNLKPTSPVDSSGHVILISIHKGHVQQCLQTPQHFQGLSITIWTMGSLKHRGTPKSRLRHCAVNIGSSWFLRYPPLGEIPDPSSVPNAQNQRPLRRKRLPRKRSAKQATVWGFIPTGYGW